MLPSSTGVTILFLLCTGTLDTSVASSGGMLYPRDSETRQVVSLDGIWNFRVSPKDNLLKGLDEKWYNDDLTAKASDDEVIPMPVPSSYNDVTQDANIRDHVGLVWYDRTFFVPVHWYNTSRVWLRFSSISYAAQVWINGDLAMSHEIGHLPFHRDVTSYLRFGKSNRVTVACDNTLLSDTVPQGKVQEMNTEHGRKLVQAYSFDFFNYAGIHRPVTLYTTPFQYVDDIDVHTAVLDEDNAIVTYNVTAVSDIPTSCFVRLVDARGNTVAKTNGSDGELQVLEPNLWWPYLMHPSPGYMYTLEVQLYTEGHETLLDVYRLPVGIRTVSWTNTTLLMNDRPLYLHGFGRHEDADIRGKGLDLVTVTKDHNLIKWVGGNAYRTSHYPYADEIMDFADREGIMIIDECPSVDTEYVTRLWGIFRLFSPTLLEKHKASLTELIRRDKNRPSVIAWSVANEPRTQSISSGEYFKKIIYHVKTLDQSRPTTIAIAVGVNEDHAGQYLDIISFNRYNSWYSYTGHLDTITENLIYEATAWRNKYKKPVLMSEYGADTIAGLHLYPAYVWSEEFQQQMMSKHFKAFDYLRDQGWFIGEFIWNFADFNTAQSVRRVGGNKKGIFTRQRQPKASAHLLRQRYLSIANEMYNATLPDDLYLYVAPTARRDEL